VNGILQAFNELRHCTPLVGACHTLPFHIAACTPSAYVSNPLLLPRLFVFQWGSRCKMPSWRSLPRWRTSTLLGF
jgi:hypothetical protein